MFSAVSLQLLWKAMIFFGEENVRWIEIRLCNPATYVFKGHVNLCKIYMVKFNVSILNRLKIMGYLLNPTNYLKMKQIVFFIIFEGLPLKQIKNKFLVGRWESDFKVACRVQIWKKTHFDKVVTSLVTALLKMTLCLCIYFVLTKSPLKSFKPILNWYIKLHHVYFNDFDLPFKNICH